MPLTSKIKKQKIDEMKTLAKKMYADGYVCREIGEILGRSHTWVWLVIKEENKIREQLEAQQRSEKI